MRRSEGRWQAAPLLRQWGPCPSESPDDPQFLRIALGLIGLVAGAGTASAVTLSFLTEENPPFNYSENGKIVGSVTEIVRQISTRAGHPAAIEIMPWDDAYVRAQAERNTCVFATARLENRERLFLWVGPLATNYWALFGKVDFAVPIRTIKDLAPYRIGAVNATRKANSCARTQSRTSSLFAMTARTRRASCFHPTTPTTSISGSATSTPAAASRKPPGRRRQARLSSHASSRCSSHATRRPTATCVKALPMR